ncbi:MAG: hypothetical protein DME66_10580 [Verrucomicrobia bacterium]|nr:MAG: hypothetical protein DME66_10580 [Verrucomicrobiota bacterium]
MDPRSQENSVCPFDVAFQCRSKAFRESLFPSENYCRRFRCRSSRLGTRRKEFWIAWGTEPNGNWFSWNGKWNGGAKEGPARCIAAYRHIVDLMRNEGADNLLWVWHVNWLDEPDRKWNAFENYFPGENYCDWIGLSAYGPTTPTTRDGTESFAFKMREAYPRLTKIAPGKPIIIAEFGCDLHNRHVDAVRWAKAALEDLFSNRWPAIIGFCWWNEGWQNDDRKKHDTDMIVLHNVDLTGVFRDEFARHDDKIQESAIISPR